MTPGDRLDGKWEVVGAAPAEPSVGRWRAVTLATAEPVEVLGLQPAAAWNRTAHGAFLDAHRALQRAEDPALVRVHAVGWGPEGSFVVRAPLEDLTLADLAGPLAPAVVAGIGARLVPAVLAAGGATGGALLDRDVGLDAHGAPVLAPRARPGDRVVAADARAVAPEAFRGRPPDGAAALFGLGMVLYRLATGREPMRTAGTPIPAGNWVPGLPPALDRALSLLLDPEPSRRASALPLLAEIAGPVPDLRRFARRPVAKATVLPAEVKLTATADTRSAGGASAARADLPTPRSAAIVAPDVLARLSPAERSALAGHAALPVAVLDHLAREGLPLVLDARRSRDGAVESARTLARETSLPVVVEQSPGVIFPATLIVLVPIAVAIGALGIAFPPLLVGAAVTALVSLAVGLQWRHRGRAWRRALEGRRALHERPRASARVAPRWDRLALLRRELARAPVPETAAADLRGALREVERHLEDLDRIEGAVEEALSSVHASDLRARVTALSSAADRDPKADEERRRLARTLADVEAVQERQERLRADLGRVDDALDDLAAVLAEIGTRVESGDALEALRTTTRIARESLGPTPARGRTPEVE